MVSSAEVAVDPFHRRVLVGDGAGDEVVTLFDQFWIVV
jgi:hypothetical protein